MLKWPEQSLKILGRTISDHCPLHLHYPQKDWGPNPLKIFNAWLTHPNFNEFFTSKWASYVISGWGSFVLEEKLKLLKGDIKIWSKSTFGQIEDTLESRKVDIEALYIIDDALGLEEEEIIERNQPSTELLRGMIWKERKTKNKWIREGDVNSCYYHRWINKRTKSNALEGLLVDNVWVESVEDVKKQPTLISRIYSRQKLCSTLSYPKTFFQKRWVDVIITYRGRSQKGNFVLQVEKEPGSR